MISLSPKRRQSKNKESQFVSSLTNTPSQPKSSHCPNHAFCILYPSRKNAAK